MSKAATIQDMKLIMYNAPPIGGYLPDYLAEALYAAGYRKPPMEDCPECHGTGHGEVQTDEGHGHTPSIGCGNCGGTGKLPERPKVLSDEEIKKVLEALYPAWADKFSGRWPCPSKHDRAIAQAAVDDAIRHYEGEKDA